MIVRIVVMYFDKEKEQNFIELYKANEEAIRNFPGCLHLQIMKNSDVPYSFSTWSHWENTASIENYRHSSLFLGIWARVKPMFTQKTYAVSLENI